MKPCQTLEEAIREALLQHAFDAHLPLTVTHVGLQAVVAVRAAQTWSAAQAVDPMAPFLPLAKRPTTRPRPPASDPAPTRPTGAVACWRRPCLGDEQAVGWRWYLVDSWKPVCGRHMTGSPEDGRRFNRDYERSGR